MTKKTVDLNLYQDRYKEMDTQLTEMGTAWDEHKEYFNHIDLVRRNIQTLQAPYAPEFDNRDNEAIYHRSIWPLFYGKLFFYLLAQRFCFRRHVEPSRPMKELVAGEEQRINRFFSRYREFWADYHYGVNCFSEQFTRDHSRYLVEPLSMILDAAGGTIAGYRVAWGLAYEEFRGWLHCIEDRVSSSSGNIFEWRETKSAAAELIKSQVEAESVYINGKPATAIQLRTDFERRYNVNLKDFDNLLYAMDTLKVEDTPYLTKLKQQFSAWKKRLGK